MNKLQITELKVSEIKPYKKNARVHDEKHIGQIASSIKTFKFTNPVLIDENNELLAGHGRLLAAKNLKLDVIPVIRIDYLDEAQKKAYRIADNQLTIRGDWDKNLLGIEFKNLSELNLDFDLSVTGFETSEIDLLIEGLSLNEDLKEDKIPYINEADIISKIGDIWQLGRHYIICGDSTKSEIYNNLLGDKKAKMIFTDPPYNVSVNGHVCGLGKTQHKEFAMASGEMSPEEFKKFLKTIFKNLKNFSVDGSLHYLCMDWRHIMELMTSANAVYTEMKNLCVWNKDNGGMGSLYRSKHELIFIYKNGTAPHINNVELGKNGRYRTNVWDYAGINSFAGNKDDLKMHPTVKPVKMIEDAILDVTKRKDIVLDAFLGSGSTLIACEKTGRTCFGIEIEPLYIDTTIRRWEEFTGEKAVRIKKGDCYV
ncbi:MAG: DNA methylase N-4 [Alphaproteobacteria bacterium]|nr:DNA methylase N-4 [Alphaproteobacteria bacterium]